MDPNELKAVVEVALKVREQDTSLYCVLLTVMIGSLLAALFGTAIAVTKEKIKTNKRSALFGILALVLFVSAMFLMRARHAGKRDFCTKWLANHSSSKVVSGTSSPTQPLVQMFFDDYSTYVSCSPLKDPNDLPSVWPKRNAQGNCGFFFINVGFVLSACCLIAAVNFGKCGTLAAQRDKVTDEDLDRMKKVCDTVVTMVAQLRGSD